MLTSVASGVRLDYEGHVASGFAMLGQIEQPAVQHVVARQFQALADEIERRSTAAVELRSVLIVRCRPGRLRIRAIERTPQPPLVPPR